jgi:hypothetical protein
MDAAMMNAPISVTDASSMFRKKAMDHHNKYTKIVISKNNDLVDEWEKKVLRNIADKNGNVVAGRVYGSWKLYLEGKEIYQYMKLREEGAITSISTGADELEFWKTAFESDSVSKLHSYGTGAISYGWGVITRYTTQWYIDQMWEKIFSKSEDPLYWEKNYHVCTDLIYGDPSPFWDKDQLTNIRYKIGSILQNVVTVETATNFSAKAK